MAWTNCVHEANKTCIPATTQSCDRCPNFEMDTNRCGNHNTYDCPLKKKGTDKSVCPCAAYSAKGE